MYMKKYTHMHVCVYVCTYVGMYVCTYVYTHKQAHIYSIVKLATPCGIRAVLLGDFCQRLRDIGGVPRLHLQPKRPKPRTAPKPKPRTVRQLVVKTSPSTFRPETSLGMSELRERKPRSVGRVLLCWCARRTFWATRLGILL